MEIFGAKCSRYRAHPISLSQRFKFLHCVVPQNIFISSTALTFSKTSSPPWKFQLLISFTHFLNSFGLPEPPPPRNYSPFHGGVWTTHYITVCVVLQNDIITYYRDNSQAQMQLIVSYFLNISQQLRKSL